MSSVDPGATWTVEAAYAGRWLAGVRLITGSGGSNRLVFGAAGTIDLTWVSGFPTIVLTGSGANSISLQAMPISPG